MTSYGHIDKFRAEDESVEEYLEQIDIYFRANDIADEKKVSIFLRVLGGKTYSVLRDLLAPVKPQEKSFDELASELKKYFQPKRVVIVERFHFHRRNQAPEESITNYIAQLRRLAMHCEFGDNLNKALRDSFVCGLKSEVMQKHMLSAVDLTLKRVVEIAQAIEAAEHHDQQLKMEAAVRRVSPRTTVSCNHCGKNTKLLSAV